MASVTLVSTEMIVGLSGRARKKNSVDQLKRSLLWSPYIYNFMLSNTLGNLFNINKLVNSSFIFPVACHAIPLRDISNTGCKRSENLRPALCYTERRLTLTFPRQRNVSRGCTQRIDRFAGVERPRLFFDLGYLKNALTRCVTTYRCHAVSTDFLALADTDRDVVTVLPGPRE